MRKSCKALFTAITALILVLSMTLGGCAIVTPVGNGSTALPTEAAAAATQQDEVSYVSIDINPSIELTLSGGLVTQAKAYNEDGAAVTLAANVVGMTPQEAVKAIVNEFASQGYIVPGDSSPAIVITVAGNKDAGLADALKQNAEESLSGLGLEAEVLAADVAEEIVQTAADCNLSVGKYLILKQIALKEGITIEEAKEKYGALKMSELLALVGDKDEFIGDVEDIGNFLNNLTPEQLQLLKDAQLMFRTAMKGAQQAFLTARTNAKEAYMAARDAAKDAFLKTKDKAALKLAKQQIKDVAASSKKSATDGVKQARIIARNNFFAAVAALGLDEETLETLADWDLGLNFDFDMDLNIENEDQDNDSQGEDQDNDDQGEDQDNDDQGEDQDNDNQGEDQDKKPSKGSQGTSTVKHPSDNDDDQGEDDDDQGEDDDDQGEDDDDQGEDQNEQ